MRKYTALLLIVTGTIGAYFTWTYYEQSIFWEDAVHITGSVFSKTKSNYVPDVDRYTIRVLMHDHPELCGLNLDYGGNPYLEIDVSASQFEEYNQGYDIRFAYRTNPPRTTILEEDLNAPVPKLVLLITSVILLSFGAYLFYSVRKNPISSPAKD